MKNKENCKDNQKCIYCLCNDCITPDCNCSLLMSDNCCCSFRVTEEMFQNILRAQGKTEEIEE